MAALRRNRGWEITYGRLSPDLRHIVDVYVARLDADIGLLPDIEDEEVILPPGKRAYQRRMSGLAYDLVFTIERDGDVMLRAVVLRDELH